MAQEPENLPLHHLRELRELVERHFETLATDMERHFEIMITDMEAMRAEMRETRSALVGVGPLVYLLSGDMKVELEAIRARLDRLERERA